MIPEYLIHLPDGSTDGPYTEEDLLDMVDADELSAGAVCEDTVTGRRLRVRQLFQVIPPAAPGKPGPSASAKSVSASAGAAKRASAGPAPARWVPAPFPQDHPAARPAPRPPARTYYRGSPSPLNSAPALLLSAALAAGGCYAGRWDGAWLAWGWMGGCAVLAAVFWIRSATEYRVTGHRVESHTGLFLKRSGAIPLSAIRSITVRQSGLRGLLGVGTVIFSRSAAAVGEDESHAEEADDGYEGEEADDDGREGAEEDERQDRKRGNRDDDGEEGPGADGGNGRGREDVVFHRIWRPKAVRELVRLLREELD